MHQYATHNTVRACVYVKCVRFVQPPDVVLLASSNYDLIRHRRLRVQFHYISAALHVVRSLNDQHEPRIIVANRGGATGGL